MGTLLDTTVFIELERAVRRLPLDRAWKEVSAHLQEQLGRDEDVGIAAITASELLHGVHRAIPGGRREAFVEAVLAGFPPISVDLHPRHHTDQLTTTTIASASRNALLRADGAMPSDVGNASS